MTVDPTRQAWFKALFKDAFGPTFWGFAALAVIMAGVAWYILGEQGFLSAWDSNINSLATTVPRMFAALLMAGLIWVLMPRELLSRFIGKHSGVKGLIIAACAGVITPGGPAASFPLLAVLGGAGADRGIMIAYITSWATLGMQRILVWDLPFMGGEFTLTRILVSLPLPIIAGFIARRIPINIVLKEEFVAAAQKQHDDVEHGPQEHRP